MQIHDLRSRLQERFKLIGGALPDVHFGRITKQGKDLLAWTHLRVFRLEFSTTPRQWSDGGKATELGGDPFTDLPPTHIFISGLVENGTPNFDHYMWPFPIEGPFDYVRLAHGYMPEF
jgi:hypothetical protein